MKNKSDWFTFNHIDLTGTKLECQSLQNFEKKNKIIAFIL